MAARETFVGAVVLVTAAALLTACRSSPKSEIATDVPTSSSPVATSTAPVLPADLDSVEMKVSDLPTGWTSTTNANAVALGQAGCLESASGRVGTKSARYLTFAGPSGTPIFTESLAYVGTTAASTVYAAGVKALNACGTVKIKVGKVTFSGPLAPTSFPVIGTQSQAYTLTFASGAHVLTEYVLLAEEPGVVMMTSYASVKTPVIADFLSLTSKASSKLTQ